MLRVFDLVLASLGLVITAPILLLLLMLGYFDTGAPLFCQQRVGKHQRAFTLFKLRTMRRDTAAVGTHLADPCAVTRFGVFLRKTKLDELPQLWNVLRGDMSLVGPRPGLFNQQELLEARSGHDVFSVRPGITGLAQVTDIDMSTPQLLAQTDRRMIDSLGIAAYFKYIVLTATGRGQGDRVNKDTKPE